MIRLDPAYIGIQTEDQRLENDVEEVKQLERRHIIHGTIPDPYLSSSSGYVVAQGIHQPSFQMGSVGIQIVSTSQQHRGQRMHRSGRHNRR